MSRVLLAEPAETLRHLFDGWLDGVETRQVATAEAVIEALNGEVVVACLSRTLFDDGGDPTETETLRRLLEANPYCQLVALIDRSQYAIAVEPDYDDYLGRPVYKDDLRTTVSDRFRYGLYSRLLHRYYRLNAVLSGAEEGADPASGVDPEEVRERLESVEKRLVRLRAGLTDEDVAAIVESRDLHGAYLRESEVEADGQETAGETQRCPNCRLPWGVDHGGELRNGYVRLGAQVRRCTRCGEVIHGLGSSHRYVA